MRFFDAILAALGRTPRWLGALLALGWAAVIFSLSSNPPLIVGERDPGRSWLTNLAHAPEHGIFALFVLLAFAQRTQPGMDRSSALELTRARAVALFGFLVLFAISDELHQSFTPGRDASIFDVMTDVCGGLLVIGSVRALLADHDRRSRWRRVLWIGIPACCLTALCATLVPPLFPEIGWL